MGEYMPKLESAAESLLAGLYRKLNKYYGKKSGSLGTTPSLTDNRVFVRANLIRCLGRLLIVF